MRHLKPIPVTILALAVAAAVPALARTEPEPGLGDAHHYGDYGRVRYDDNGMTIERADTERPDEAVEQAGINAPIFPGDTLRTDGDQRVEIELFGGTLVRVDRVTDVTFLALPSPDADYSDNTILQLHAGTIHIDARVSNDGEFRIDADAGSVYLFDDGDYRISVDDDGRLAVMSRRGVAEVSGAEGSTLVRSGMQASVYPGELPERARPFNTLASDRFDRWIRDREDALRVRDRYRGNDYDYDDDEVYEALPYETRPYYSELSSHGRWVYVSTYGWCWVPRGVGVSWRPYTSGYWRYGPRGYFWVSYEPWGWAPYHYGRWNYVSSYGWCWVPGRVFGGAWVSWSWGSLHVGWAPLDYWGRPAFIGTVRFGYYDPSCWTFVGYRHFGRHYYGYRYRTAPWHTVRPHVGGHAVVTRAPRVAPRALATDQRARDRAYRTARDDIEGKPDRLGVARRGTGHRSLQDVERGLRARNAAERTRGERPASATGRRALDRDRQLGRDERAGGPERTRVTAPRRSRPDRADTAAPLGSRPDRARRGDGGERVERAAPRRTQPDRVRENPSSRGRPGERSRATTPAAPRRSQPDRAAPRDGGRPTERPTAERTQERRRELYRGVTRERQRDRAGTPDRPPTGRRDTARPAPGRSSPTPRATPNRGGSRPSPKAAPKRGGGSRPAPKAAPKRGGGSRPAPKAAPKRGGSKSGGKSGDKSGSGKGKSSRGRRGG